MATATPRRRSVNTDPFWMRRLQTDFGFATETKLRAALEKARLWSKKNKILFWTDQRGTNRAYAVELGRTDFIDDPAYDCYEGYMGVRLWTNKKSWERPVHRRLLRSATALFLMSHPVLKRAAEARYRFREAERQFMAKLRAG